MRTAPLYFGDVLTAAPSLGGKAADAHTSCATSSRPVLRRRRGHNPGLTAPAPEVDNLRVVLPAPSAMSSAIRRRSSGLSERCRSPIWVKVRSTGTVAALPVNFQH